MIGKARRNRRRGPPLWTRVPPPRQLADACGRAVRRAAPALIAMAAAGVVAGGVALGYRFVTTSPRFALADVEIRGARALDPASVRGLVPARPGTNLFSIDLAAVAAAVGADPWIAKASVHRELPRALVVDIAEQHAAAVVDLGALYLASADGRPFKRADVDRGEGANLPVVTGVDREQFLADPDGAAAVIERGLHAIAAWRASGRPDVGEVHVDPRRGLTLYTRDDAVAIRLGDVDGDQLSARLRTFDTAWAALAPDERRRARAVHLDNRTRPDHVTVAFAK